MAEKANTEKKEVAKAEVKTTPAAAKTTVKPAPKKAAPAVKKADDDKVYHISKRKSDRMWQVKAEGSPRALKRFFTQAEAVEYAKTVAGNNEGRIVIHKEDGSFRKLSY